jgi:hypothetical protein
MRIELIVFAILLSISGIAYALDCATNAYVKSCDDCGFNASGAMYPACYTFYQEWGKKCIAEKRPLLASAYNNGQCPQVDACSQELQSCKSAASTGNDKQDCLNPLVGTCFTAADACVAKADAQCNADVAAAFDAFANWCPLPVLMVFILVAGLFYARSNKA